MKPRPIRIEGNTAYVKLTRGYEAIIDAASIPDVAGVNWYALVTRGMVYAVRSDRSRTILMHRHIARTPDGLQTDHVNGDGLDNRLENLRHATASENQHNKTAYANNTSGYKGVSWKSAASKWQAVIKVYGKQIHIGVYADPADAGIAYREAAERFHGRFARVE